MNGSSFLTGFLNGPGPRVSLQSGSEASSARAPSTWDVLLPGGRPVVTLMMTFGCSHRWRYQVA